MVGYMSAIATTTMPCYCIFFFLIFFLYLAKEGRIFLTLKIIYCIEQKEFQREMQCAMYVSVVDTKTLQVYYYITRILYVYVKKGVVKRERPTTINTQI